MKLLFVIFLLMYINAQYTCEYKYTGSSGGDCIDISKSTSKCEHVKNSTYCIGNLTSSKFTVDQDANEVCCDTSVGLSKCSICCDNEHQAVCRVIRWDMPPSCYCARPGRISKCNDSWKCYYGATVDGSWCDATSCQCGGCAPSFNANCKWRRANLPIVNPIRGTCR